MRPLDIVVLHEAFPLSSETFVVHQVEGLIGRGHRVSILADWAEGHAVWIADPARVAALRARTFPPEVPPRPLPRMARAAALLLRHPGLFRTLHPRWGRDGWSLRALYRTARFARFGDVDVVVCHFGPNGLRALPMLGRREKLVTFFHGYDLSSVVRHFGVAYYRALFRRGDLFVAVSERFRRRLIELGCDSSRVVVHPTGVQLERFPPREPRPLGADGVIRMLSVGRLVPKKGIEDAIEAVAAWRRDAPRLDYRIVGDGKLRGALAARIAALGLGDRVTLSGWVAHHEMPRFLAEADVLVQPSVTAPSGDEEGIPVVVKEAMAAGLPVIATRHGGIPEIVEDGETGLLVPEHSPGAIVRALECLLDDPALAPRLARNALTRAEREFDQHALDERFEKLLVEVVGG